jgi:mRNA interferase MazF
VKLIRGDIYYADLSPVVGSEQGGIRPVLIIQNDVGNEFGPTVVVAAFTSAPKRPLPVHVKVSSDFLPRDSYILCEQLRTIDKRRLKEYIGHLEDIYMVAVKDALIIELGLGD